MKAILKLSILYFCITKAALGLASTNENIPCTADEDIIFLCETAGKIAALCSLPRTTDSIDLLQYIVINKKKRIIEFAYPKTPSPSKPFFVFRSHPLPGGIDTEISFSNNGYTYSMHEKSAPPSEGKGFEGKSEIFVRYAEETLQTLSCLNEDSEIRKTAYEIFSNAAQPNLPSKQEPGRN